MDSATALERLAGIREGLQADGYDLHVGNAANPLVITVVAGPDSCADCLVPKSIMAQMLGAELDRSPDEIELIYPADGGGH
jgi:hypothetical protein